MDPLSSLVYLPTEIKETIYSFLPGPDLWSLRCTCHSFANQDLDTRFACLRIQQGYLFDVVQKYLLGKVSSRVLAVYLEAIKTITEKSRSRVLSGFFVQVNSVYKKIKHENDWLGFIPFVELALMPRDGISGLPIISFDRIVKLSVKRICDDPLGLPPFVMLFYRLRKTNPTNYILYQTMVKLFKTDIIHNLPLDDDLWAKISASIDQPSASLQVYYSFYKGTINWDKFNKLDEIYKMQVTIKSLIPKALQEDSLECLCDAIGFEMMVKARDIKDLLHISYLNGKHHNLSFLRSLVDDDEKQLLQYLLDEYDDNLYFTFFTPKPEVRICDYNPLKRALKFQLWQKALEILFHQKDIYHQRDGACLLLDAYLNRCFMEPKKPVKRDFISKIVQFATQTSDASVFFKHCFTYQLKISKLALTLASEHMSDKRNYYFYCIMNWLPEAEEKKIRYFESFIFNKLSSIEDQNVKDHTAYSALQIIAGDYHIHPYNFKLSRRVSKKYRRHLFSKFYKLMSSAKQYDVMMIKNADKYLPRKAFLFPTLKLT